MTSKNRRRTDLERGIANALERAGLAVADTTVIAAVSGGADSVGMLSALAAFAPALHLRIFVAHLNHGIRSAAADDDADFVQDLCTRLRLELDVEQVDVPSAARMAHRSIEMQARAMRYAFFQRVAQRRRANAVLTAHTLDDQAETLLLNLCRGAGPAALGGIPPDTTIRGTRVVRPLLNISRVDIEHYLHTIGQTWREDASNQDTLYRRNAVRHRVLPLLKETLNSRTSFALARAATILRDDNALLDSLAAAEYAALRTLDGPAAETLPLRVFRKLPPALRRRLLVTWLREKGLPPERLRFDWIEQIDALACTEGGGGGIQLTADLEVRHEYDRLRCVAVAAALRPAAGETILAIPGLTPLPAFGCSVEVCFDRGFLHEPSAPPGTFPAQVHLRRAPDEAPYTISVRARKPGDRIGMIGMEGERKVQDILTDAKIPASRRNSIPLFCVNGEVIWIPGCRPARQLTVPDTDAPSLRIRIF